MAVGDINGWEVESPHIVVGPVYEEICMLMGTRNSSWMDGLLKVVEGDFECEAEGKKRLMGR